MNACAANQIDEHGLYSIILVVSHTDAICLNIFLELSEVAIAKVAGGKFDALLVNLGIEPCVEMDAMEWDA